MCKIITLAAFVFASFGLTAQTVDQQYSAGTTATNPYNTDIYEVIGQTFTAGISGPLSMVRVRLYDNTNSSHVATMKIYPVDGSGAPIVSTALATSTVTVSGSAPVDYDFIFTNAAPVVANTKYAFGITCPGNASGLFNYNGSGAYSGGDLYYKFSGNTPAVLGGVDFNFSTFVGVLPLPVTLNDFKVNKVGKHTTISWTTVNESNSDRFEVERSVGGQNWINISTINVSNGGTALCAYNCSDPSPLSGKNFYRLKMIDLDGSFSYSQTASATFSSETNTTFYPNPVKDLAEVHFTAVDLGSRISLTDATGKVIHSFLANSEVIQLDMYNYIPGIYWLRVGCRPALKVQKL